MDYNYYLYWRFYEKDLSLSRIPLDFNSIMIEVTLQGVLRQQNSYLNSIFQIVKKSPLSPSF